MADAVPNLLARDARFGSLSSLTERIQGLDVSKLLVNLIDLVDEDALLHLADQFHIIGDEGWLLANTAERRRNLIKQSIETHRYKGTVWAVKSVLAALAVSAEITEWWQTMPPGTPHTFDLLAWVNENLGDSSAVLSPMVYQRLRRLVDMNKPVRSHFSFRVGARFDDALRATNVSQVVTMGRWPADPVAVQPPPAAHLLRAASAARSLTVIRISMEAL